MKSVTTILKRVFPMKPNIPKHILENARIRGVSIHEWVDSFNKGKEKVINMEYQQYIDEYKKWFREYEVEVLESELKLSIEDTEDEDGLIGIIDMLCKTKEHDKVLVSLKITNKLNLPYCELQESAYNELLLQNKIIDKKVPARVLHINKMGYNYIELEDHYELFMMIKKIDKYLDMKGALLK